MGKLLTALMMVTAMIGSLAADSKETIVSVVFRPGPTPPPLVAPSPITVDEVFILDNSYSRKRDTKGLFPKFEQLAKEVEAIQTRVYATNQFFASLHNYDSKLKEWCKQYAEENGSVYEWLNAQAGTPSAETNKHRFKLIRSLMLPVFCLELMEDPAFSQLITESIRIQLDPPVPAYPPCIYMIDGLLGLPTATNMSLRLPANPPPTPQVIRKELEARAAIASKMLKDLGPLEDFPTSEMRSIKVFLAGLYPF